MIVLLMICFDYIFNCYFTVTIKVQGLIRILKDILQFVVFQTNLHKPHQDQVIDTFILTAIGKKGTLINIIRKEAKATVIGNFAVTKKCLAVFMKLVKFLGRSIEAINIHSISPPSRMQFKPVETAIAAVKKG